MQLLGSREGLGAPPEDGGSGRESYGGAAAGGARTGGGARKPAPAAGLSDMDDDIPF
jgi:hypothetical protein